MNLEGIEIRNAPGGDENNFLTSKYSSLFIEIRYAPGGDENVHSLKPVSFSTASLRLDMPREGTKTLPFLAYSNNCHLLRLDMPREGTKT